MAHSVIIRNFVAQSHFECCCKVTNKIANMQEKIQKISPVKQRILQFVTYLGISKREFYKKIDVSRGTLENNTGITEDILARFIATYPMVKLEWLLKGIGDMIQEDNVANMQEKIQKNAEISYDPSVGTPYYDVDFFGGFSEIINDQTRLPACNIVVPGLERATVWCNVTGHSMEPRINHGDIIALRECTIQDIQYGETYAVVLDTIRTIKILRRGSSPSTLLYVPVNKSGYDDQEFDISRIIKIFEVVGSISKFF